jgi:hypothetical protein
VDSRKRLEVVTKRGEAALSCTRIPVPQNFLFVLRDVPGSYLGLGDWLSRMRFS